MIDESADSTQQSNVILFADVVGSTSLYETIGNVEAKYFVDQALSQLSDIADSFIEAGTADHVSKQYDVALLGGIGRLVDH